MVSSFIPLEYGYGQEIDKRWEGILWVSWNDYPYNNQCMLETLSPGMVWTCKYYKSCIECAHISTSLTNQQQHHWAPSLSPFSPLLPFSILILPLPSLFRVHTRTQKNHPFAFKSMNPLPSPVLTLTVSIIICVVFSNTTTHNPRGLTGKGIPPCTPLKLTTGKRSMF